MLALLDTCRLSPRCSFSSSSSSSSSSTSSSTTADQIPSLPIRPILNVNDDDNIDDDDLVNAHHSVSVVVDDVDSPFIDHLDIVDDIMDNHDDDDVDENDDDDDLNADEDAHHDGAPMHRNHSNYDITDLQLEPIEQQQQQRQPHRSNLKIHIPNYEPVRRRENITNERMDNDVTNAAATTTTPPAVPYTVVQRTSYLMQNRVAAHRLQYMEECTQHILDQPTFRTLKLTTDELRDIFLYWLSRPVRDMFYHRAVTDQKSDEKNDLYRPIYRAYDMVQWFMHQFDHVAENDSERHIIAQAMVGCFNFHDESRSAGLCRLMRLFCQALQGTNATIKEFGGRRMEDQNVKVHMTNLLYAGRVYDILHRLQEDDVFFPDVVPDEQSYQSILNLIGKRCRLLVLLGLPPHADGMHFPRIRRGIRWTDPQFIEALGGCLSTRKCVDAALRIIEQMKTHPNHPNPTMIHYSMLLSMMSYSAGQYIGMADEAYAFLKELVGELAIKDAAALYNPVLLAYVMEAAELKKRQSWEKQHIAEQKCEQIWETMRNHPSKDPTITSDPITYSIMIKLYRNMDQANKAQDILLSMEAAAVARSSSSSTTAITNTSLPPDPSLLHYNSVLNAWAKSSDPQAGERAMTLVRRMEEKVVAATGLQHPIVPRPDHVSFTSTLDALLRGPNVKVTIAHMEQILQRFEASEEVERRPDAVTYNVIFHSLFRQLQQQRDPHVKAQIANEMEELLYRLQNDSPNFRTVAGPRIFRYYNECLKAWSGTNSVESPSRALRLLKNIEEVAANGTFPSARPNGTTYQYVLLALSHASDDDYADYCRDVFTKMERDSVPVTVAALLTYLGRLLRYKFEGTQDEADNEFVEVLLERFRAKEDRNDAFVAGMVFEGIFNNINREADVLQKLKWSRRYEKLFRALLKEPHFLRVSNGESLTVHYNNCIKAWAFARTSESTANALRLLREMEESCEMTEFKADGYSSCRPNVKTYEYVLTCLTRVPDLISLNSAREIFRKMEMAKIPITLSLLNQFIRILSYSGAPDALKEAEHILKIVEEDFLAKRNGSLCPNYKSYSFLVEGHMRSKEGLCDAERIIDHMKELAELSNISELLPPPKLYIDLINAWSNSLALDAIERVDSLFRKMVAIKKPSNYEYYILQSAWCRSNRADAPQQVESILVAMQQEYEQGNNPMARPTIENFDLVIKAWATSLQPNSVERADAILKRLEDLCHSDRGADSTMKPSTSCYQHALLGWTLSNNPDAGERALAILDRMKKQHQNSNLSSTMINQVCYHHTITAIGKSRAINKTTKCYAILEEMLIAYETSQNRSSWPTHETFRLILGVCASCTNSSAEKDEALDVCVRTMKKYLQLSYLGPRTDVYVQFLYAVFRLLPAGTERDNVVLSIFADENYICPAAIFDAVNVREALTKTVSPKVFADIARICGRNPMLKSLNRMRFP